MTTIPICSRCQLPTEPADMAGVVCIVCAVVLVGNELGRPVSAEGIYKLAGVKPSGNATLTLTSLDMPQ